jgi:phosphoglycolate phosphatase
MKYKLVIFDFDGTLADTLAWFTSTINSVADRFKIKRINLANLQMFRGLDAGRLIKDHHVPVWKIPMIANHMRSLMAAGISKISLFNGVDDCLRRLSANNAIIAVVSSNSLSNILQVLGPGNASLIRYFECGVSLSGKQSKIKKILRKTRVAKHETIMIGDEIRDALAAKKARIAFGAVSWGYNSIEILRQHSPAMEFRAMDEIAIKLADAQ